MSWFSEAAKGFIDGAMYAAAETARQRQPQGQPWGGAWSVDHLCRQLGWDVDERHGTGVTLHFRDPILGVRKVTVIAGDSGKVASFLVSSASSLRGRDADARVLAYLLARNAELPAGAWQASVEGGAVTFMLRYTAFTEGVDSGVLKFLCESMVREAHDFDAKMQASGML